MPDDNTTTTNPANVAAPTLPTVAPADAAAAPVAEAMDTPAEAIPTPEPVVPDTVASDTVVTPVIPDNVENATAQTVVDTEIPAEVARKIGEAHNVLVALSSDPSVDEMAAAIGLSLYLDKLGKRATAIYSGATPNALEFLKPEETFEESADTLQDFVIALNKDKADHLRYKLDGDFVKIYITPYKSRISEEDLEFSYGDYNVDLVLALDVANGVDLDTALREHGRIMHDAVIINITTGNPGKLGEIEWSDKTASSVSEMIARLLYSANSKVEIGKEEATAFLTGIVAATNRFSNAGTTPSTMQIASKLMESGANQQLVSKNITPDIENELFGMPGMKSELKKDSDPTKLDIEHGNEGKVDESKEVDGVVTEKESTLLDDLKAAEASLAAAETEAVPEAEKDPLKIDSTAEAETLPEMAKVADVVKEEADHDADMIAKAENSNSDFISDKPEKVIQPLGDSEMAGANLANEGETDKYGQMLEDALANAGGAVEPTAPIVSDTPATAGDAPAMVSENPATAGDAPAMVSENPATTGAPEVPVNPEINGVPEINYMPMPGDEVLPPPPAPPVMQDQVYTPQAADPGAFKIPGM